MHFPTGARLGLINAVQALSTFLVYPAVAWVCNKYGRKLALYIGYFFLFAGTALQTAANNETAFIISRFLLGQPSAWFIGAAPLLVSEIAYPTHRGTATSLYNCGWYIGSLVAAWVTFGTRNYTSSWSWRIPSLLQAGILVLGLLGVILCPESPRYLISVNRVSEAREILITYHGGGDHGSALAAFETAEIQKTIKLENEASQDSSWMDLVRTKGNRHRTFISISLGLFTQWNGNGVVSYYLSLVLDTIGVTDVTDQTLINGFLQLWNLLIAVYAAFNVDRFGGRMLFLISSIGMLVSYITISGLSGSFAETGSASVGVAVIPILFIFFGAYDLAFTPFVTAYPCEIWPFRLRARGLSLTATFTYIGIFFNAFVNPIALDAIGWKYYLVFVVILVIIIITIYFCYPETRGYWLEEIAIVFDGPNESKVHDVEADVENQHKVVYEEVVEA